jgi:hypothetical protein
VAISSSLNPATIARERPTTATAAQNFITGGAPLGEGVIASAANKIVGFQRGAAGVAARPPDLNGIIQTLSTNILNNVENRVQSVNQNVTQVVNRAIGGLEKDYKERLDKIDAAKPNSILQNFLNLYQKALGYIQFLGNRKNVKTLGENLKSLQNIFTETFNVAKIIRQVIVKIVKQLSSLPTSTGGGGGLNLDIDIPGGSLRKGPMGGISRMMRRRPGLMLGGAALAGGLGSQVVSGMMDLGGDVQAAPMTEGTIPTSLLDRFNGVLDRFSAAINSLSKVKRTQSSSGGKGTTPQPKQSPDAKPGAPGAPGATGAPGVTTTGEKGVLDLIASVEQGPEGYNSFNTSRGKTKGKATEQTIGWLSKNARGAIGRYQQMPEYLLERAKRAGFDENTKFTPEVQDAITLSELKSSHGMNQFLSGKISEEQFLQKLSPTWRGLPQGQINAGKLGGSVDATYQDQYASGNRSGKTYKQVIGELKTIKGGGNVPVATTQPPKPSTVVAAPNQSQAQQQAAQSVSQAPVQQKPQVTVAPMNMASPQTQSAGQGGKSIPPPQMSVGGVSVPFFSSSNTDNFLTLYSKIVYNIVDG